MNNSIMSPKLYPKKDKSIKLTKNFKKRHNRKEWKYQISKTIKRKDRAPKRKETKHNKEKEMNMTKTNIMRRRKSRNKRIKGCR